MPAPPSHPTLFLSAGEASGDHYGAQVAQELRRRNPQYSFFGLGGKEMEANGLERIVHAEDIAVMGITEVVRHMPRIYAEYRKLAAAIKARKPDLAILIDFPDVNFRLAKVLKSLDIPVIFFVSPQLWAWKRSRLKWVQQRISKMLVIFPFEEPFYRARNVDAQFVGHPLATLLMPSETREAFAAQYDINPSKQWISLLPGSRQKEILANLGTMLEATDRLPEFEFLIPLASTISRDWMQTQLKSWMTEFDMPAPPPRANLHIVDDARSAMFHSRASIVASGTATVQAAVIGNPFIVVYQVSNVTFRLAKRLVRYPAEIPAPVDDQGNLPIAMVNLIAGNRIVPELLQDRFTAENLVAALTPLLNETPERHQMIADLATVRQRLLPTTASNPIYSVCEAVQSLLGTTTSPMAQS